MAKHIKELQANAAAGDPEAQFKLGIAYSQAIGVSADPVEAKKWMEKAADGYSQPAYAKNGDALYRLGSIYAMGMGIPKDMKKAAFWWEKAAEQGNIRAEIITSAMYYSGVGGVRDYVTADKWLHIAQMLGDSHAGSMIAGLEKNMAAGDIAEAQAQADAWKAAHPH